jgi:2-oxo-hept-3-ene-1,7-dioate hydratase/2-keto-4-pentenoate hydratase
MLSPEQVNAIAADIWHAEQTGEWTEPPSSRYPDVTVEDGYAIGIAVRDLKLAAGRSIKGHKIGLTSKAMRDMTGATEPDYGFIYDDWFVMEGGSVSRASLNRPMVEVELAFVMKERLQGPSVHVADVIRATDFVLPALELVDSRYQKSGSNMLVDSIADTAWCGGLVLGANPMKLTDIDVRRVSASLTINGEIVETGSASAVMANPINAVAWLANTLHRFDTSMEAGDVILSGSFIRATPINAGDSLVALFDGLGEVTLRVGP